MLTALDNRLLDELLQQVRPLIGQGNVADYIPVLAEIAADRLAIAVCTVDGEMYQPRGVSSMRYAPEPPQRA